MRSHLFDPLQEFNPSKLKVISGTVPKQINGQFFRNGVARLNYQKQTSSHLFLGDGGILKLQFRNGQCTAQAKYVDTPVHRDRQENKTFNKGWLKQAWNMWKNPPTVKNMANTSVLLLKNSPNFLALVESYFPTVMKKQNLETIGSNNFGWIDSGFSAHPKVDPDNGDIYNIGNNIPHQYLMKMNKNMQLIKQISFKMKYPQSLHDMCLAGDYIVIFQYGIQMSLKNFFTTLNYFKSIKYNPELSGIAHIYRKDNLELVTQLQIPPFYCFHFTNGFSTDNKIIIEFSKYAPQEATNLFNLLAQLPQYTQLKEGQQPKIYPGRAILTRFQFKIDQKQNKITLQTYNQQAYGEFPLCEDHQVGKEWRTTYLLTNKQDDLFFYNQITKYDRETKKSITYLDETAHFNEPAIVRCGQNVYLISVVNRPQQRKTYVQIFEAQNLTRLCQMELPEYVPPGFHCKWENFE